MHVLPRHQCIIYEGSPSRQLQSVALTIIGKVKRNQRCLYLNSPLMVAGISSALTAAGFDLGAAVHKGDLILTSDQGHLVDGVFDIDRMMDRLSTALQQALADGYAGLWATGDMTWELGNKTDFATLLEYEQRLETFIQNNPSLSGVCQYCCNSMPPRAIEIARHTHPAFYVSDTHSHPNPDYGRAAL